MAHREDDEECQGPSPQRFVQVFSCWASASCSASPEYCLSDHLCLCFLPVVMVGMGGWGWRCYEEDWKQKEKEMQATLEANYADESDKAILLLLLMHGTNDKQEQVVCSRGREAPHRRRSSAAALGRLACYNPIPLRSTGRCT